jgi:hypothetical protein
MEILSPNIEPVRAGVIEGLVQSGYPQEVADALGAEISIMERVYRTDTGLGFLTEGLAGVTNRRWVIRDDDLNLSNAVWDSFKAAIGTEWISGQKTWAGAAAVAAGVFRVLRSVNAKTAELLHLHYKILVVMKHSGPLALSDLTTTLNDTFPTMTPPFTDALVKSYLDELVKFRVRDGTVVALVALDGNNCWATSGI